MQALAIIALVFASLSIFIPVLGIFLAMLCSIFALITFRSQPVISGVTFGLNIISTAFLSPNIVAAELANEIISSGANTTSDTALETGSIYIFYVGFHLVLFFLAITWRVIKGSKNNYNKTKDAELHQESLIEERLNNQLKEKQGLKLNAKEYENDRLRAKPQSNGRVLWAIALFFVAIIPAVILLWSLALQSSEQANSPENQVSSNGINRKEDQNISNNKDQDFNSIKTELAAEVNQSKPNTSVETDLLHRYGKHTNGPKIHIKHISTAFGNQGICSARFGLTGAFDVSLEISLSFINNNNEVFTEGTINAELGECSACSYIETFVESEKICELSNDTRVIINRAVATTKDERIDLLRLGRINVDYFKPYQILLGN